METFPLENSHSSRTVAIIAKFGNPGLNFKISRIGFVKLRLLNVVVYFSLDIRCLHLRTVVG